jgi:hypothetical protein
MFTVGATACWFHGLVEAVQWRSDFGDHSRLLWNIIKEVLDCFATSNAPTEVLVLFA